MALAVHYPLYKAPSSSPRHSVNLEISNRLRTHQQIHMRSANRRPVRMDTIHNVNNIRSRFHALSPSNSIAQTPTFQIRVPLRAPTIPISRGADIRMRREIAFQIKPSKSKPSSPTMTIKRIRVIPRKKRTLSIHIHIQIHIPIHRECRCPRPPLLLRRRSRAKPW